MPENIPKAELDKVKERFSSDLELINRYFDTKESSVLHSIAFTLRRHPDSIPSLILIARKIQSIGTPANKSDGAAYAKEISLAVFGVTRHASVVRNVFNKYKFRFLLLPVEPPFRKKKRSKKLDQEEAEKELGRIANEELAERQEELAEPAERLPKAQAEPRAEKVVFPMKSPAPRKYPAYLITPETLDVILADRLQRMKEDLEAIADPRTLKIIDFLIDQLKKGV